MGKPRILCLTPYFLPSQNGGGSVTALVSLVERLKADFDFIIATGDRDLGAATPYSPSEQQQARQQTGVEIHYLPRGWAGLWPLLKLLRQDWHLLYLNSFLSLSFCALPLLLGPRRHAVLLAPRGELMSGALEVRRERKLLYLRVLRAAGVLNGIRWQATSALEAAELRGLGVDRIQVAADLPPLFRTPLPTLVPAAPGPLRIVFLSRIEAKKNLLFALKALCHVQAAIEFDVVGPVGDADYWAACKQVMAALPANVKAVYRGPVRPAQVLPTLSNYELFLLPTRAENNGYVIHEALLGGCALLISDQTPWRGLTQAGVGADLPLDDAAFANAITRFAKLPAVERLAMRERARQHGLAQMDAEAGVAATRALLLGSAS